MGRFLSKIAIKEVTKIGTGLKKQSNTSAISPGIALNIVMIF